MADADNPIINCTMKQLAFVAWQCAKHGGTTDTLQLDLDMTGPAGAEFRDWWAARYEIGWPSIKASCWEAWQAGSPLDSPRDFVLFVFMRWWWVVVLAGQPVVS